MADGEKKREIVIGELHWSATAGGEPQEIEFSELIGRWDSPIEITISKLGVIMPGPIKLDPTAPVSTWE